MITAHSQPRRYGGDRGIGQVCWAPKHLMNHWMNGPHQVPDSKLTPQASWTGGEIEESFSSMNGRMDSQ